jgi:flagellar motor protein MotB
VVIEIHKPARLPEIVADRPSTAEAKEKERKEKEQLESLLEELRKAIALGQALEPYKDQLLLDITPEGLRIQIVDKQNRPMFDTGSSALKDYTTQILLEVAKYLNGVPNRISLSGHTDAKPYPGTTKYYSNWELSADRANAARRALIAGGLDESKIARVVGLASSVLFDKSDPLNPINRRISIIVMTRRAPRCLPQMRRRLSVPGRKRPPPGRARITRTRGIRRPAERHPASSRSRRGHRPDLLVARST